MLEKMDFKRARSSKTREIISKENYKKKRDDNFRLRLNTSRAKDSFKEDIETPFFEMFYEVHIGNGGKKMYRNSNKAKTIFLDGNYDTLGSALYFMNNPVKSSLFTEGLLTINGFVGGLDYKNRVDLIVQMPTSMTPQYINFTKKYLRKFFRNNSLNIYIFCTRKQYREFKDFLNR